MSEKSWVMCQDQGKQKDACPSYGAAHPSPPAEEISCSYNKLFVYDHRHDEVQFMDLLIHELDFFIQSLDKKVHVADFLLHRTESMIQKMDSTIRPLPACSDLNGLPAQEQGTLSSCRSRSGSYLSPYFSS